MATTTWKKTEIRLLCPVCRDSLTLESAEGEFYTSALRLPQHEDAGLTVRTRCEASHRQMAVCDKTAADLAVKALQQLTRALGR